MRVRRAVLAATLPVTGLAAFGGLVPAKAATPKPVTVALLDTGIFAGHQEFAAGQVVAWKDFTAKPKPTPYDDNGHGTITASMVGGLNKTPAKTPSFAPGVRLAIGKVLDGSGSGSAAAIAAGIRWATDQKVDIINMSLGSSVPLPGGFFDADAYNAIAAARAAGILVVVANGNGFANAGVPGEPGWFKAFSSSTDVLSVGASDVIDGVLVDTEPEVTAQFNITGPATTSTSAYVSESGTSFSSPLTAGFAANALAAARTAGRSPNGDTLESIVKACARDTALPPSFEGYGIIDAAQVGCAVGAAKTGVIPAPNATNKLWVETVSANLRKVGSFR